MIVWRIWGNVIRTVGSVEVTVSLQHNLLYVEGDVEPCSVGTKSLIVSVSFHLFSVTLNFVELFCVVLTTSLYFSSIVSSSICCWCFPVIVGQTFYIRRSKFKVKGCVKGCYWSSTYQQYCSETDLIIKHLLYAGDAEMVAWYCARCTVQLLHCLPHLWLLVSRCE